jgi:hypothetical protein
MGKIDELDARLNARMEAIDKRLADRMAAIDAKLGDVLGGTAKGNEASAAKSVGDATGAAPKAALQDGKGPAVKLALCVGLNQVDAQAYPGYDIRPLAGCVVDVQRFKCVLDKLGFKVAMLVDGEATCRAVYQCLQSAAAALNPGDLFVFHISGHGGRAMYGDKMRENWCLYDGFVWDDVIVWMFSRFKPGVRVLVINDQCHSGGIFQPKIMQTIADIAQICARDGRSDDWDAAAAMNSADFPMLIQFAGCRAEQTSIDGLGGGTWTQALINVLDEAAATGAPCTYRTWFDKAFCSPTLKRGSQDPQWVESPQVTDDFRQRTALD